MGRYGHLSIEEREEIMCLRREHRGVREIARKIGRDKSTVSRELARNSCRRGSRGEFYRASTAQRRYEERRSRCRRPRLLDDPALRAPVQRKIVEDRWSPEQVAGRIALETGGRAVSAATIYRAINGRALDTPGMRATGRGMRGHLRHRGKRRRRGGEEERRGRIRAEVADVEIAALSRQPRLTVTPDRGKEFADWPRVKEATGAPFYFCAAHHPWEKGSVENANGLLREYFPKGTNFASVTDEEVAKVYAQASQAPGLADAVGGPLLADVALALKIKLTNKFKDLIY